MHTARLDMADRPLRLTVLVDESSVEVFADGGRLVFTDLVFPRRDSRQIRLVADGGTAWLTEGTVTLYGPAISR